MDDVSCPVRVRGAACQDAVPPQTKEEEEIEQLFFCSGASLWTEVSTYSSWKRESGRKSFSPARRACDATVRLLFIDHR